MSPAEFLDNGRKIVASIYGAPTSASQSIPLINHEDKELPKDALLQDDRVWNNMPPMDPMNVAQAAAPEEEEEDEEDEEEEEEEECQEDTPSLAVLAPMQPVASIPMSALDRNMCYRCNKECQHHCQKCKVACHGSVIGCSKALEEEEGKFLCFLCFDDSLGAGPSTRESEPVLDRPPPPKRPKTGKSFACPKCGKSFAQSYNIKRHMKTSACSTSQAATAV